MNGFLQTGVIFFLKVKVQNVKKISQWASLYVVSIYTTAMKRNVHDFTIETVCCKPIKRSNNLQSSDKLIILNIKIKFLEQMHIMWLLESQIQPKTKRMRDATHAVSYTHLHIYTRMLVWSCDTIL